MALVVFLVIKAMNSAKDKMEAALHKEKEAAEEAPPEPSQEEVLLTEIRDLLKEQKK